MASIPSAVVEEVLARLYFIVPEKRVALRGRMKHFQRMGFPAKTNTGKGVPAKFTFNRLMQLVFAFELVQSGLDPSAAKSVISEHWSQMSPAVARAMVEDAFVEDDPAEFETGAIVFAFYIDGLHALQGSDEPEYYGALKILTKDRAADALRDLNAGIEFVSAPWRTLLIDAAFLVDAVCQQLSAFGYRTEMRELFEDLAQGEPEWEDPYLLQVSKDAFDGNS